MVKKKSTSRNGSENLVKIIDTEKLISVDQGLPPLLNAGNLSTRGTLNSQKLQILLNANAFSKIDRHIRSDMSREVGGFLIGRPYEWEGKRYVEISDAVAADAISSSAVHLTFSSDNWAHATASLRDNFPGMYMVGWYHTHPRMPLFLSTQDLAIHEGFFREAWHVALVLDPTRQSASFFIWDEGHPREVSGYQILFPPDVPENERWHMPDVSSLTISMDAVLEDFYEPGCWISRWHDDEFIVKLQGDEIRILRQKLQKTKFPRTSVQLGFCVGKEITHKLKEKPHHMIDVRVLYPFFADRHHDDAILQETMRDELQKIMARTEHWGGGLQVVGLYLVAPALPQPLLRPFLRLLSERYRFLLTCDIIENKFTLFWRSSETGLVERELVEVTNLAEINDPQLRAILLDEVKTAYENIRH